MTLRQDWSRLDALHDDPDATEAAAQSLPSRAGWLLRAVAAVQRGERTRLSDLATRADADGQPDIARVLRALLGAPLEPEGAEKIEHFPLTPLLDLLAATRAGQQRVPDDALIERAADRPVLASLLDLLGGTPSRKVSKNPLVEHLIPRAEQLRSALHVFELYGTVNAATLARAFATPLVDLSPGRWPDLSEALHPRALLRWARSSAPWQAMLMQPLKLVLRSAPPELQRQVLAAMLRRFHRDLAAGRFRGLQEPLWAASEIAAALEEEDISEQLYSLQLRLQWLEDDAPPGELLESQWAHQRDLSPSERLTVARALLDGPSEEPHPGVMMGAQLFLMAHLSDPTEASAVLSAGAWSAPAQMIVEGLQRMKAPELRVHFLMGTHSLLNDAFDEALGAVSTLIAQSASIAAQNLLFSVLQRLQQQSATPPEAALLAALTAFEGQTLSLDFMPLILSALKTLEVAIPTQFRAAVEASINALGDTPQAVAAYLYCLHVMGDDDAAREKLRAFGRSLRKAPNGDDLAALTIAWTLFWSDTDDREAAEALIHPLTRFLLRDGVEKAVAAAVRNTQSEPLLRGLVQWFLWNRDTLGDDPRWFELCCKVVLVPESLTGVGAKMVKQALADDPTTLEALRVSIHFQIGELLESQQAQE